MLKGLMRLEDRIVFSASPAPTAEADAATDDSSNRVLLVDTAVHDADALVRAAGNDANQVEVLTYDSRTDTLDSIQAMIRNYLQSVAPGSIDSIAFAGYGEAGRFGMAVDATLDLSSLGLGSELVDFFNAIAGLDAFSDDFRIDLLGCDIAAGPDGQHLIDTLEELTGINFAASTNRTGSENLDGDWMLETDDVDARADYFNDDLDSDGGFDSVLDDNHYWIDPGTNKPYATMPTVFEIKEETGFLGSGGLDIIGSSFDFGDNINMDFRFLISGNEYVGFQEFFAGEKIVYGSGPVDDSLTLVADSTWSDLGHLLIYYKNQHIGWITTNDVATDDFSKFHYVKLRNIENDNGTPNIKGVGLDEIFSWFRFKQGSADKYESLTLNASFLKNPPGGDAGWMKHGNAAVTLVPADKGTIEPPPPVVDPTEPPGEVEPPPPPEPLPGDEGGGDDGDGDDNGNSSDPTGEDPLEGEDGSEWDDLFEEAEQGGDGGDGGDGGNGSDDNGGDPSDQDGDPADESPVLGSDLVSDIYGDVVGMEPGDSYSDVINAALQRDFGAWFKSFSGDEQTSPDEVFARLDEMLSSPEWADGIFTQDEALALGLIFSEMRSSLDIITGHIQAVFTLLDDLDSTALPPELVKWVRDGVAQARSLVGDAAASIATLDYAMGRVRAATSDLIAEAMIREVQLFMARISRELRLVDGGLVDFVKLVGEQRDRGEIDGSGILTRINRNQALRWMLLTQEAERRDGFHLAVQGAGLDGTPLW